MEDNRALGKLFATFLLLGLVVLSPLMLFAYDENTTHPALTQEIVRFYNSNFSTKQLSKGETELVIKGSIDEDGGSRWLQHFYDPVKDRGLVLGDNDLFKNRNIAAIVGGTRSEFTSSKSWARSPREQAGIGGVLASVTRPLFSGENDYSWDRAIYEYAWGDGDRGLLALGHVLHLLEDATVPDHTRNDPHIPKLDTSPFEFWTTGFNLQNISIASNLEKKKLVLLPNLEDYFESLADYSNSNFFSKDTIFSESYAGPKVAEESSEVANGINYRFGYARDENGNKYRLVKIDKRFGDGVAQYSIEDRAHLILSDYWSLLSKQAVLNGAGVVKLFFDEVEKEKETKALYSKNRSLFGKWVDAVERRIFGLADVFYGISTPYDIDALEAGVDDSPQVPELNLNPFPSGVPAPRSVLTATPPSSGIPAQETASVLSPESLSAEGQKATTTASSEESISGGVSVATVTGGEEAARGTATGTDSSFLSPPLYELVISPVYRRGPPETAAAYTPGAMDVVVNEIAWAGTADAATDDEWIELYNRTSQSISLSGWVLRSATDEKPYINLSGTIAAGGYYLIERDDDNAISDVSADLAVSFGSAGGSGLIDTGEALILQHASTTIDQTPALNSCGLNQWCGGNNTQYQTMERIDPDLSGTDSASWSSNDGLIRNGKSSGNVALNGTPRKRNSRSHYIAEGGTLTSSKTLTKEKSPYFIDSNGLAVNSGVTLTINSGAVIKLYSANSNLTVNGTLKALGASADNIIFTSFRDDEYGGDLNGDGAASSPAAGDWQAIILNSTSQNSEMSYTRMRYGGASILALLKADNASISVSNSIFESGSRYGVWLINSTSTISNSVVKNNSLDYGLRIQGGAPTVQNNTFDGNFYGIGIENQSTAVVSGNTIASSTDAAIVLDASSPTISANTASTNGVNGIFMSGAVINNFTFVKGLPYVVNGTLTLSAGKTFTASAGAVFKGKSTSATFTVQGLFNVNGSAAEPVVFTSFKDDNYGGDANNDGAASSPAAGDWRFILYESTATTSAMNYGLVRYGGSGSDQAVLVDSARVDFSSSTFESNKASGLRLSGATSTLNANTFRNHQAGAPAAGLYLENGAQAVLSNSSFSNNAFGVYLTGASALANGGGNTVSANTSNSFPVGLIP